MPEVNIQNPSFVPQSAMPAKELGSYPNTGIDVLIVGTGLAGLTAAIECIRKGHNVRVLERNSDINTAGKFKQKSRWKSKWRSFV